MLKYVDLANRQNGLTLRADPRPAGDSLTAVLRGGGFIPDWPDLLATMRAVSHRTTSASSTGHDVDGNTAYWRLAGYLRNVRG